MDFCHLHKTFYTTVSIAGIWPPFTFSCFGHLPEGSPFAFSCFGHFPEASLFTFSCFGHLPEAPSFTFSCLDC